MVFYFEDTHKYLRGGLRFYIFDTIKIEFSIFYLSFDQPMNPVIIIMLRSIESNYFVDT